ncbi:MAG TPA: IPT/TIG domain-containing protein, partial [Blastocatellia bacterium]|nr:IPT/TIG domain-containing protein [Blastocatellia bacterium]
GHIFKTTDSGATWSDISSGLPDIPVNTLLIDPVVPETVYAGSDIGVFRSTNAGSSWQSFDKGMPPVVVTQFTSQFSGLIQVATYGRGAFEFAGNERPVIESATYDGKKKITISGTGFGDTPRVLINGEDKTSKITVNEDTEIRLKAKAKKLGLVTGDNTVQVISADGVSSNVVTVTL